jgi:glucose-1-phosphate thymidylyltransferase
MKCLLLGAGYATRLYPLTKDRPKPLLPVAGVPILQRICEQLFKVKALDKVYVVTNHRFAPHYYNWLRDYQNHRALPVPIEIFDDLTTTPDDRLGAIGDIQFVIQNAKVDDDLMVIAGDNLIEFSLQDFVEAAQPKGTAACLKDLKVKKKVSLYGAVEVNKQGRVIDFEEKPPRPRTTLISIGVYFFSKAHLPLFRQYLEEGHSKDAPGFYLQWLHKQIDVHGHVIDGEWYDIGDIDSYNAANEIMMKKGKE